MISRTAGGLLVAVDGSGVRCWQRESAAARLYGSDTEITGLHSWLTDSGPVAALDVMLAAHTKIIHRLPQCYFRQFCSDVLFLIYVCDILRYLSLVISRR